MVDKQLVHLLDSSDVSERERAIKAMARSGDPAYISYLNVVIKTDPDSNLRTLASKAIKYINQQSGHAAGHADEAPSGRTTPKRVEVSAANERRATSMLDRAMELSTRREDEEARDLVLKAYKLDPNIQLDAYKRGLVGAVMGMGPNEAFDILDDLIANPHKIKRKSKRTGGEIEEVSWGTALLDLAIYGAVVGVSLIIAFFLLVQFARPTLQEIAQSSAYSVTSNGEVSIENVDPETAALILNGFLGAGAVITVVYALVTAIMNVIGAFIFSVFIHFAAKIIGGDGTLPRLINKTVPLYTIGYIVGFIFMALVTVVAINDTVANTEIQQVVADNGSVTFFAESDMEEPSPVIMAASLVGAVLSFVFFIVFIGRIAAAYDFGWLRGCIAYILSQIFATIAACGCAFVMTTFFASMLASFLNNMAMASM
ncbi:hypothetical protein VZO05_12855 [Aggregatilineales bacterium SYSU G02658]